MSNQRLKRVADDHPVVARILDLWCARRYAVRMAGTLYVVPTPIGDLSDLSPRARQTLSSVDRIAAEDTRITRALLRELGIAPPLLVSYHDHNELERAAELIPLLLAGSQIALVSDAGTPLVSDPGYRLVVAAIAADVPVVVLPGPCAAVAALSGSGLPPDRFLFLGFLPRDPGPREAALAARRAESATIVLYEAPHRLLETLASIRTVLGDRRVAVARSLTKVWEQWIRGTVTEAIAVLQPEDPLPGEFTVVIEGDPHGAAEDAHLDALIDGLVESGVSVATVRDVVARVYDRPRRSVYQRALAARRRTHGTEEE